MEIKTGNPSIYFFFLVSFWVPSNAKSSDIWCHIEKEICTVILISIPLGTLFVFFFVASSYSSFTLMRLLIYMCSIKKSQWAQVGNINLLLWQKRFINLKMIFIGTKTIFLPLLPHRASCWWNERFSLIPFYTFNSNQNEWYDSVFFFFRDF
jgi:hypothetical protein